MNICLLGYSEVAEGNFYNGIAKVVYYMTDYFRQAGNDVFHYHLFSRKQYKELNTFLAENHIDIAIWHMSTLKVKGRLNLPCPLISMWHSDPNGQVNNYVDLFCAKYHVGFFVSKCLHLRGIEGCLSFFHKMFNDIMFFYVVKCSDKFVLLSEGYKNKFFPAKYFGNKIVSIPNGIIFKDESGFKKNSVVYVGRLRQEKQVDILLKIWAIVEKSHRDWNLLIVGDGPEREKLLSLAKELHLHQCEFIGWQKDPTIWLNQSKIMVLTSQYEGFPLVLVEAAQLGVVPVIFNSFASASDIITDDLNGKLILPFNTMAFANNLLELMDNPTKLTAMSLAAKTNASRYDLLTVMQQWNNLINTTIANFNGSTYIR